MINVKKFIKDNADYGYAEFNRKFITSQYEIVGVRIPLLKKFVGFFVGQSFKGGDRAVAGCPIVDVWHKI